MLIRLYNGQRYLSNLLPNMDEISGPDNTSFYACMNGNSETNGKKLPEYTLNEPIVLGDIDLDIEFKQNYRDWLEKDVYSTSSDDDDDDDKADQNKEEDVADWSIGTPIPNTAPQSISAEQLTEEINKLYIEEFYKEFNEQKENKPAEEVTDGWDKPVYANTNAWGVTLEETNSGLDVDEVEPEFNPLQGIYWESLTEDELQRRLEIVEEKTAQRWMNVDLNDPRYLKVLNTFEDEIPQDDEGWPIW